jgi:hypothetical protein
VNDSDSVRASYEAVTNHNIRPPGRELRLITKFRMSSDKKNFHLISTRELFEATKLVREKKWEKAIRESTTDGLSTTLTERKATVVELMLHFSPDVLVYDSYLVIPEN